MVRLVGRDDPPGAGRRHRRIAHARRVEHHRRPVAAQRHRLTVPGMGAPTRGYLRGQPVRPGLQRVLRHGELRRRHDRGHEPRGRGDGLHRAGHAHRQRGPHPGGRQRQDVRPARGRRRDAVQRHRGGRSRSGDGAQRCGHPAVEHRGQDRGRAVPGRRRVRRRLLGRQGRWPRPSRQPTRAWFPTPSTADSTPPGADSGIPRMDGFRDGIKSVFPDLPADNYLEIDTAATPATASANTLSVLNRIPADGKIILGGINDENTYAMFQADTPGRPPGQRDGHGHRWRPADGSRVRVPEPAVRGRGRASSRRTGRRT